MTNLELEQKIIEMDEAIASMEDSLIFQSSISNDEEEIEFNVADSNEEFFVTQAINNKPEKRPNNKSKGNTPPKVKNSKNEQNTAREQQCKTESKPKETAKPKEATPATEIPPQKDEPKTIYREGTESPFIKITPFVTEQEPVVSEEVSNNNVLIEEESAEQQDFLSTEEFLEEKTTVFGEVETSQFEDEPINKESKTEYKTAPETDSFKRNNFEGWQELSEWIKKGASVAAVIVVFILCTSTYNHYIKTGANMDEQAKMYVKETAQKAETNIEQYKENKTNYENQPNTVIASSDTNVVKLERLMNAEEANTKSEDVATTRFNSLSELTSYINENTLLLNEILENSEKQYQSGTISATEYGDLLSKAKDKLAELSTLLTTNRNIYTQEERTDDYDILYDNINIINTTY